ncbi:MAG TPA: D-aminoacylase [Candidatus Acidoferrales bacterium]|jgi:N-acyl-D-amino-acid deacylase|nr:D-aminoacylase [Candidatus Acidoferrales bacterium]
MVRSWLLLLAFSAGLLAQPNTFDVLITGGKIVDGSGGPWYYADIGIKGDTVTAIGNLDEASAAQRVDARGLVVAPGFIDIHSHGRRGIFSVPTAENYLREGVTTFVEGPDGSSPLPLAAFLEQLRQTPVSVNIATMVGQGTIRSQVLGLVNRRATPQEIEKMKELAAQAMRDGAFGLSTGLFYVPGNFTPTEEVIELAKVVGRMGGIHISHMREEAGHVLDSVRETIRIGEEGGLPTQITHHKIIGQPNWGQSVETLRLVEEARARGVDVTIDQYPYTASSTGIAALFPQWALEGGQKSTLERLTAPGERARIKAVIVQNLKTDRGAGDPKNVAIVNCGFDGTLAGKNLADLTRARGAEVTMENAAETAMELQSKGGCSAVYHAIDEADVVRIMKSPYTMIASDGDIPVFGQAAPHPRSYGTFARVLGVYVREKKVLTLEEAVRRMSGFPAERLKLWDRGQLRPGLKADLVIFDPAKVADRAEYDKPHQYSVGFRDVMVNGVFALRGDAVTAARPGRVLYGPGKH